MKNPKLSRRVCATGVRLIHGCSRQNAADPGRAWRSGSKPRRHENGGGGGGQLSSAQTGRSHSHWACVPANAPVGGAHGCVLRMRVDLIDLRVDLRGGSRSQSDLALDPVE